MQNARASNRSSTRSAHGARKPRNGFLAALELVVKHGRESGAPVAPAPYRKRCPKCGWTGLTDRDFGMRTLRGRQVPQSWCRLCRRAAAETEAQKRAEQLEKRTETGSAWLFPSLA